MIRQGHPLPFAALLGHTWEELRGKEARQTCRKGQNMLAKAPKAELQPGPKRDVCFPRNHSTNYAGHKAGGGTEAEKPLASLSHTAGQGLSRGWGQHLLQPQAQPSIAGQVCKVGNNREMAQQPRPEWNKAYLMGHRWNANTKTWNPNNKNKSN